MTRFTLFSLIALFLAIAYYFCPLREPRFHCGTQEQFVEAAFRDGYGWLSTAVAYPGYVIQTFVDDRDGRFLIIGIDNDFNACIVMQGIDWQYVLPSGLPSDFVQPEQPTYE